MYIYMYLSLSYRNKSGALIYQNINNQYILISYNQSKVNLRIDRHISYLFCSTFTVVTCLYGVTGQDNSTFTSTTGNNATTTTDSIVEIDSINATTVQTLDDSNNTQPGVPFIPREDLTPAEEMTNATEVITETTTTFVITPSTSSTTEGLDHTEDKTTTSKPEHDDHDHRDHDKHDHDKHGHKGNLGRSMENSSSAYCASIVLISAAYLASFA